MPLTLEQAKALKYGDIVFYTKAKDSKGKFLHCKVNGKIKVWKRDPSRVSVPIKHGLYEYSYINERNLEDFNLEEA